MFRLFFLLALMPTYAAADWSPRPAMFTYNATFDVCTRDPSAPDLAATCADLLNAAYVLKRAVARATIQCHPEDLATCALPYEDEGLPHIAMRIALDVGCEATDITMIQGVLPPDHCVTIASDIMIDEGIVPLNTQMNCLSDETECTDLIFLQAQLWEDEIFNLVGDDALVFDLLDRIGKDCAENGVQGDGFLSAYATDHVCISEASALLWADLVQQTEGDN